MCNTIITFLIQMLASRCKDAYTVIFKVKDVMMQPLCHQIHHLLGDRDVVTSVSVVAVVAVVAVVTLIAVLDAVEVDAIVAVAE